MFVLSVGHIIMTILTSNIPSLIFRQHIPDVRIYLVPKLHVDRESIVTILLSNPSQEAMEIQLEALNEPPSTGSVCTKKKKTVADDFRGMECSNAPSKLSVMRISVC